MPILCWSKIKPFSFPCVYILPEKKRKFNKDTNERKVKKPFPFPSSMKDGNYIQRKEKNLLFFSLLNSSKEIENIKGRGQQHPLPFPFSNAIP